MFTYVQELLLPIVDYVGHCRSTLQDLQLTGWSDSLEDHDEDCPAQIAQGSIAVQKLTGLLPAGDAMFAISV